MLGIVTVNWRGYEMTRRLVGILLNSKAQPFLLAVVNNSPEEAEQFDSDALFHDPSIIIIHSGKNTGYAGGLNLGITALLQHEEVTHFLLLNNDVTFETDFLDRLRAQAAASDMIYAPLILYEDTNRVQNTGGKIRLWLGGTTNLNKNAPIQGVRRQKPDFLSGCILYMPRGIIETVGLFDEAFGSYYEDVDFCLRARSKGAGLEILYDIQARHYHSHATRGNHPYKVYLINRNQIIFAKKHLPPGKRALFILAAVMRGAAQSLLQGQFRSYFKGVCEGLSA